LWAWPALAQRPPYTQTIMSARGFPLAVHGGDLALMTKIRDAADRAWQAEMIDSGWTAPLDDGDGIFDLYIDLTLALGEAYTVDDGVVAGKAPSYIGLPSQFVDDDDLFSVVAHEMNHASQYAIDALEDDAFFEHTAVFVERRVANHYPTWGVGVGDYQAHPERALDYILNDYYEYGAGLWLMFLSERLDGKGDQLVQRLWHDSAQPGSVNSPHFLDALDGILRDKQMTRARFFSELALWRWFTGTRDDGKHFSEAAGWPEVPLDGPTTLGAFGAQYRIVDGPLTAQVSNELAVVLLPMAGGEPVYVTDRAQVGAGKWLLATVWAPAKYDPNTDDARTAEATVMLGKPMTASSGCSVGGQPAPTGLLLLLVGAIRMRWT
jgi:hypothetical protein